jgi:hypothetical protein
MDERGRSDHDHVVDSAALGLDQAVRDPVVLLVRVSMNPTRLDKHEARTFQLGNLRKIFSLGVRGEAPQFPPCRTSNYHPTPIPQSIPDRSFAAVMIAIDGPPSGLYSIRYSLSTNIASRSSCCRPIALDIDGRIDRKVNEPMAWQDGFGSSGPMIEDVAGHGI